MKNELHRHDLSDGVWGKLEPRLPGKKGEWCGAARDRRQFVNAVLCILRTGVPWRDKGVWGRLLSELVDDPDFAWSMIDGSHVKAYFHVAGAVGGNGAIDLTKGSATSRHI